MFKRIKKLPQLLGEEIWQSARVGEQSITGRFYLLLRVVVLSFQGIGRNRIFGAAASLAYSSLLALGPMLAIVAMVSGFILQGEGREGHSRATELLTELMVKIAPQAAEIDTAEARPAQASSASAAIDAAATEVSGANGGEVIEARPNLDPEIMELVDGIVASASSGALGVAGSLLLIPVVILLLINVEKNFNLIWGVRQGRTLVERIVFYWTLITLGAIVGFAAVSLKVSEMVTRQLSELPSWMEGPLLAFVQYGAPVVSLLLLIFLLAAFYRFIPNTSVSWLPALFGATTMIFLFWLYNKLSFLLAGKIETTEVLYGSLGVIVLLLFGLYLFWGLMLFGGQLTYATQNANRLANQRAWEDTSVQARELLCLGVLASVARRFHQCAPAPTADELAERLRAPGQVVNEALFTLTDMKLVTPLERDDNEAGGATRYQPCRPVEKITLATFRERFATLGVNQGADLIDEIEPVLPAYREEIARLDTSERARTPLAALFDRFDAAADTGSPNGGTTAQRGSKAPMRLETN